MVMSELTKGGRLAGLLVFLSSWTKGPYIDPDQQGDNPTFIIEIVRLPPFSGFPLFYI